METIDSSLASTLQAVNSSLATFFAAIITVAYVANCLVERHTHHSLCSVVFPLFLIPACIIGFAYRELAIGYLNTGRDLRRMESNTRSPIFSGFGELLEGIVTVRAFSAEQRFLDNLHTKINLTSQVRPAGTWMVPLITLALLDVVQLLDDKQMAAAELRCPRGTVRIGDDSFCVIRVCVRWSGRPLHHVGHGVYQQHILGLQILDRPRA